MFVCLYFFVVLFVCFLFLSLIFVLIYILELDKVYKEDSYFFYYMSIFIFRLVVFIFL
jgi:hypothetical protein